MSTETDRDGETHRRRSSLVTPPDTSSDYSYCCVSVSLGAGQIAGTSVAACVLRTTWAMGGGTCSAHNCGRSVAARALRTTVGGRWRHVLCAQLWAVSGGKCFAQNYGQTGTRDNTLPCVPEVLGSNHSRRSCYSDRRIS
jgi:hypothetical protein